MNFKVKDYYTRIKNGDPTVGGGNKYVQGVIMGYMDCICRDDEYERVFGKPRIGILVDKKTGDTIYHIITMEELYRKFADEVEHHYPGVCEFDIFD